MPTGNAYVDLFESGEARIKHLNQQAPIFFGLILRSRRSCHALPPPCEHKVA